MSQPTPRGPLNVYHPTTPLIPIALPAGDPPGDPLADPRWVNLARDIAGELYVSIERARHTAPPADRTKAAQYNLIVATAAVAATEIESLAALCALGLSPSAQIHARAIGITARNALVFAEDSDLAVDCYDSLEASRKELMRYGRGELGVVPGLLGAFEKRFEDAAGKSMRKLEQAEPQRFGVHREYLMPAYFQHAWSKWAHGDIVALADAGDALGVATDVRRALNVKPDSANALLSMATVFALVPYGLLCDAIGAGGAKWNAFTQQHDALRAASPIHAQVQAMFEWLGVKKERDDG